MKSPLTTTRPNLGGGGIFVSRYSGWELWVSVVIEKKALGDGAAEIMVVRSPTFHCSKAATGHQTFPSWPSIGA